MGLSGEVRRAFTHAREVVLAYADSTGPRALAVGSVSSVGPDGELRLIAGDDAWEAAERDPRVAVFVADPLDRRFWAEVRASPSATPRPPYSGSPPNTSWSASIPVVIRVARGPGEVGLPARVQGRRTSAERPGRPLSRG